MTRCVVIVLDSGDLGALSRVAIVGGTPGTNTIGNVAAHIGDVTSDGVAATREPMMCGTRLAHISKGKDTTSSGHWNVAGIHTDVRFPTYRDGFPPAARARLVATCGAGAPSSGRHIGATTHPARWVRTRITARDAAAVSRCVSPGTNELRERTFEVRAVPIQDSYL